VSFRCAARVRQPLFVGRWRHLLAAFALSLVASVAAAQSTAGDVLPSRPVPLTPIAVVPEPLELVISQQQIDELTQWTRDFIEWQTWSDRWLGRHQPGLFVPAKREKKPDPPLWLPDACMLLSADEDFTRACALLAAWRDDLPTTTYRRAAAAAQAKEEAPVKTLWWQHLHVDGLWSTTQSNAMVFGLFGAHLTVEVEKRLQVFLAPGIMLVSVPSFSGGRELSTATDWGITYRLFNAGRSTVNFNLVHAWVLGNQPNLVAGNMTLAGLSVSFRPLPR